MKSIIEMVPSLLEATRGGMLQWEYMEDAPCLTSSFRAAKYIFCKTHEDNGLNVISLNRLDRFNNLVGDFMKWNENTPEFQSLNELYGCAEEKKVLLAVG